MTGRVKVVVPTTEGPSTVLRVTPEDPSLRSVVCLGRSTTVLPISPAYDAFVRKPTGVVERAVGHPVFRVDVSAPIDDGQSWQLGLYIAHRLKAAGRLAEDDGPADLVLWATGAVDGDLGVQPVAAIDEKLRRSATLLAAAAAGPGALVVVPAAQAGSLNDLPDMVQSLAVGTTAEVARHLGIAASPGPGAWRWTRLCVIGVAVAAALTAAYVLFTFTPGIPIKVSSPAAPAQPVATGSAFEASAVSLSVLEIRPGDGAICGVRDRLVAVDPGQVTPAGVCSVAARASNGGPAAGFVWLVALAEGAFREYAGGARTVATAVGPLAPGEVAEVRVPAPSWIRRPVVFRVLLVAGSREEDEVTRALAAVDTASTADFDRLTGQFLDLGLDVRTVRHQVQPRP